MKFLIYLLYCVFCAFAGGISGGAVKPDLTYTVVGAAVLLGYAAVLGIFMLIYKRNPKIPSHMVKRYVILSVAGFIVFLACACIIVEFVIACTQYDSVSEYLANDWFAISSSS